MHVYPGGTQWNHTTVGNDFWRNYLCDLARTVALDGQPNPVGGGLAQAGMGVLTLALLQMWWSLPGLFPSYAFLGLGVRVLGSVAVACSFVVVLLPSNRFGDVHGTAIVVAALPGLVASLLSLWGPARCAPAPRMVLGTGVVSFFAAAAALAIYLRQYFVPGPGPVAGAVLERLALMALLVWLVAAASRTRAAD
jgi:hypothetical protein